MGRTIRTGAKAAAMRTQQQIADDLISTSDELEAVLRGVKDAATAKAAVPKATELTDRTRTLAQRGNFDGKELDPGTKPAIPDPK